MCCQKDKCEYCLFIRHENPAGIPNAGGWCEALTKWRSRVVTELSAGNELHSFTPTSKLQIGWEEEMGLISMNVTTWEGAEHCSVLSLFDGRDFMWTSLLNADLCPIIVASFCTLCKKALLLLSRHTDVSKRSRSSKNEWNLFNLMNEVNKLVWIEFLYF